MRLYKFRSLGSCHDLERTQGIIETGEFWCSRFWELNDPMEGVYWINKGGLAESIIKELYDAKSKHAICSFSASQAFERPLMWGYYANGFRGVAIEIDIDKHDVLKINYCNDLNHIRQDDDRRDAARRILMTKLECWSHEDEYRFLCDGDHGSRRIGQITGLFFGNPYQATVNTDDIQRRDRVRDYLRRVEALERTARMKGINCQQVDIVDGRVRVAEVD